MLRKSAFLVGLFVLCACVLILQIVETRILSVISFYHLAFFAISMASAPTISMAEMPSSCSPSHSWR